MSQKVQEMVGLEAMERVNYGKREQQHKTYTSLVAESHIESIINARYKRSVTIADECLSPILPITINRGSVVERASISTL